MRTLNKLRLTMQSWLRTHLLVAKDVRGGSAEYLRLLEGALLEARASRVRVALADVVHMIPADQAHLSIQRMMVLQQHCLLLLVTHCSYFSAHIRIHFVNLGHCLLRIAGTSGCIVESGNSL